MKNFATHFFQIINSSYSTESDRAVVSNTTKVLLRLVEPTYAVSPTVHAYASTQNTCDITPAMSRQHITAARFMKQKTMMMNIRRYLRASVNASQQTTIIYRLSRKYIIAQEIFEKSFPLFLNQRFDKCV